MLCIFLFYYTYSPVSIFLSCTYAPSLLPLSCLLDLHKLPGFVSLFIFFMDPKELVFGACSGMVGKLIEYPFDTVKVRLQTLDMSLIQIFKKTADEGIIHGFYQGIRAPLIGACMENAILFTSYNATIGFFGGSDPNLALKCASGGFAGFMAAFVLTPVELIKCQLQVKNLVNDTKGHLYTTVIRDIVGADGIKGLWKGLGSTLIREVTGTAIWFGTYEKCSEYTNTAVAGAIAGMTFNTAIFPVDTIKSNVQTSMLLYGKNLGYIQAIKKVGIRRMYNGLGITIIRSIPANAMIFYTYEKMKETFV